MGKVIVTGATGYIGASICKELVREGEQVSVIVRQSSDLKLLEDIKDNIEVFRFNGELDGLLRYFSQVKPTTVLHLASLYITAHTAEQIDDLIDSNIRFAAYIMEAASAAGTKHFINTSTSWQYYCGQEHRPVCFYAATKQAAEELLHYYADANGMYALNLTIYDSYGKGDPRRKIMSLFDRISRSGETLQMSGGEQYLELVYIDDIVRAYMTAYRNIEKLVQAGNVRSYFLHADKARKLKEIATVYEHVTGRPMHIEWGGRPYRDREVMETYAAGQQLPGWRAEIGLEEGIRRLTEQ